MPTFKMIFQILLFGHLFLGLAGCAGQLSLGDPAKKEDTLVIRSSSDEVKLISPSIIKGEDPRSLKAAIYEISTTSRLLIRLSSLKPNSYNIVDQQPLLLKLEVRNSAIAIRSRPLLKLCPLNKNWMMLATWSKAHPYKGGQWQNAGADFEPEACLEPLPQNHASIAASEEAEYCQGENKICFDLKPWFMAYVRERQTDLGLVLIAATDDPVAVMGDATLQGPSLFWRKMR